MNALPLLASLALLAAAEHSLTEERAVELALGANPQLSALGHRLDGEQALRAAAGRLENPELRVQNLRSDRLLEPALNGSSYRDHPFEKARIGLRWEPPGLGQRGERRAQAEADASKSAAELALHRRNLVARVRGLHATVRSLDAQLAVARAAQEERERARRLVERRAAQGAATVVEESVAEVERLNALANVQELEIRRRRAHGELLGDLGLPEGTPLALSGDGAAQCAPPADAPALQGMARDPRQRVIQAELRAADAAWSRRWLELVPWPSYVQVSYVFRGESDPAYWTLQLGVKLPLFDWKGAERSALASERARLQDEQRASAAAADRQLQRALAELAEQAALARHHLEAASVLEGCLQRFRRNGEVTGVLQASQIRARQLAARRAHLESDLECRLRKIEVDRLAGTPAGEKGG